MFIHKTNKEGKGSKYSKKVYFLFYFTKPIKETSFVRQIVPEFWYMTPPQKPTKDYSLIPELMASSAPKTKQQKNNQTNPWIRNQKNTVDQHSSSIKASILGRPWGKYNKDESFGIRWAIFSREREEYQIIRKNPEKETKFTWELSAPNKSRSFAFSCVCFWIFEQVGIVLWGSRFSQPHFCFRKKKIYIYSHINYAFSKLLRTQTTCHTR